MQLEALSIFCDVVRHQSFSRGAMASAVSQSAASQAVRQLEKRLGAQLIDRSTRPWRLTPEGKLFFRGCQEIIERYHALEKQVQRRQRPYGYTVRLASIYSVRLHDLSGYVSQFQRLVPGADVDLEYMHPDEVYRQVLADQCDLGLISFATPRRDLAVVPWEKQPMVVACRPDHRLVRDGGGGSSVAPETLSGEAFVAFDRGLPVRRAIDRYLKRRHAEVRIVAEFDNIETIKQAVEDGDGIAVLPAPTLRREVEAHTIVSMPFRPAHDGEALVRPLAIIHRRKRRLNPAVTELINILLAGVSDGASASAASKIEARL